MEAKTAAERRGKGMLSSRLSTASLSESESEPASASEDEVRSSSEMCNWRRQASRHGRLLLTCSSATCSRASTRAVFDLVESDDECTISNDGAAL